MLISDYINPVMYLDPSGEFLLEVLLITIVCFTVYATSPKLQDRIDSLIEMGKDGIVIDISSSIIIVEIGFALVINLEDKYIELYPHVGFNVGSIVNIDFGVIDNYESPGEYSRDFLSISASYWLGVSHSWTPDFNKINIYDENQARAYCLTISSPGLAFCYSYYFWYEDNQIIYKWE